MIEIKTTKRKQKIIGTVDFIRESTGELVTFDAVWDGIESDYNFHKVWLLNLVNCLTELTGKQMKLVFFILINMDRENKVCLTQRQMAEKVGISLDTTMKTIKKLKEKSFLTNVNSGVYMINPDIIFKGYMNRRKILATKFYENKATEKKNKIKN